MLQKYARTEHRQVDKRTFKVDIRPAGEKKPSESLPQIQLIY